MIVMSFLHSQDCFRLAVSHELCRVPCGGCIVQEGQLTLSIAMEPEAIATVYIHYVHLIS